MAIESLDLAIIMGYLVGITGIGVWFSRHQRQSSAGYFLAGRSLSWITVGMALFATNISTVHLTGLAGAGFSEGKVFGNFEWLAPFLLILLGLVFAPFYFRSKVATLPEYLEGRYGPGSRTVLAFMAVVGALFIHIGVTIYAGAEVMKKIISIQTPDWWQPLAPYLDFNIAVSISIVSLLTIIYTALGGLKAVVVTESIQTVLLLLGGWPTAAPRRFPSCTATAPGSRPPTPGRPPKGCDKRPRHFGSSIDSRRRAASTRPTRRSANWPPG